MTCSSGQEHMLDQASLLNMDFNPNKQKKNSILVEQFLHERTSRRPLGRMKKYCEYPLR